MRELRHRRLASALLAACALSAAQPASAAPAAPDGVDASVRPQDDFYRYANGPWLAATQRPDGVATFDSSTQLKALNARRVREIVETASKAHGGVAQKIGDYYASRLDTAAIEARGVTPLAGDLAAIAAVADRKALAAYLGATMAPDDGTNTTTPGVLGAWIHQSFHDPDHYVPHIVQGGLGLDREDYLDPAKAAHIGLYRAHVAAVLRLAGLTDPDARAERIVALETALARTHASRADTDDVFKTDNPWRRADFDARAPGMDWAAYFQAAGLGRQSEFVVWQPLAVVGLSKLAAGEPLQAWKDYLAYHLIDHDSAVLPKAFGEEKRAFTTKLTGRAPAAPDATAEAIAATEAVMGDAIGRLYVARYFPASDRAAVTAMVEDLRTAWRARLNTADWLEAGTKAKSLGKLDALHVDVGYPATWIDYAGLKVVRGDALGNLRRADAFAWRHETAKLAKPVDRDEWIAGFYPQQVAGFLYFLPNTELFTAGLLQPPYFDAHGDAAANYGSAGAAMAHEIGHTFDELGADYDAQGRLTHWWTKEDLVRFRAATAPLAAQYDAYCPKPSLCLKGQQLLSEDAADLAGLRVAHDAYILSLHGQPAPVIGGLTGDQRFFLAFARRWRRLQSDAALLRQVATDTHAPGEYRADTVRNVDAWQRAFGLKPGDRLYVGPDAQIRIW